MSETAAGHHDSPEEIRKHIKGYLVVGGSLYVFTVITVLIAYLQLPTGPAIAIALLVATIKASLVALYFMHLIDEKRLIRWTLLLTAMFFVLCLALPSLTTFEGVGSPTNQDRTEKHLHGEAHEGAAHEGVAPAENAEHK